MTLIWSIQISRSYSILGLPLCFSLFSVNLLKFCCRFAIRPYRLYRFLVIPPATKLGGVYWNHHVCLSVRLSSAFGFPAHNCFPFTPIIMKLHVQTPHESRMCPIDFEVQRSRSQCINYWKWFPAHNCFPFTPIIMKLHMQTPHEARMCPIDFEVKRSKVKVTIHWFLKIVNVA